MNLLPPPWPGENSPNIHPSISFQTYGAKANTTYSWCGIDTTLMRHLKWHMIKGETYPWIHFPPSQQEFTEHSHSNFHSLSKQAKEKCSWCGIDYTLTRYMKWHMYDIKGCLPMNLLPPPRPPVPARIHLLSLSEHVDPAVPLPSCRCSQDCVRKCKIHGWRDF